MVLSARLQLRQTQSLVITPQLMQAIRLLQMSSLDLDRFVAAEIEQNPLLDQESSGEDELAEEAGTGDAEMAAAAQELDADPADLSPEQAGSDCGRGAFSGSGGNEASLDEFGLEQTLAASESLTEMLERRIDAAFRTPAERLTALTLLCSLDEAGYLTVSVDEIGNRLGLSPAAVEKVLSCCQELAPTGMFARTLAECLALQLAERNRLDPAMQALLANLELLAARDRAALRAVCGVDAADLTEMIAEIRALDPKPGLAFTREPVRALVPDVFVRPAPGGGWTVVLNDEALPRLIVDRVYYSKVSARPQRDEDRKYLADCLQKASWLEKSLDQRARTILRVATEIVRRQDGFLADGVAFLKPLNLRMVADALGIHESTVSRAAANKTIATPRGIYEFRYFFTGAIAATSGDAHSAEAVKHRIRRMIMDESPDVVLSDDAIVARLSAEGVEIARRTVAKYRELMRIGSSVERRREKRLRAAS
jgi:RNA polymerase sigma-54 factor